MIHTFQISYGLGLEHANTCAYRLNELTKAFEGWQIREFLDIKKKRGYLIFTVPELVGINTVKLVKYEDRDIGVTFRIYFHIEAEILRTGTDTLDLYTCSPEHAKELQNQYAKAIYRLFPGSFNERPAPILYNTDFAPKESYTDEEMQRDNSFYCLPYLALASVKRIDFTYDIVRSSPDDAKLFAYMVLQSYYDGQKKQEKKGKQRNPEANKKECYDKEYASGSRGFSVYYKYDEIKDKKYDGRPNIAQIREDARNIVRIELPNFNPSRTKIKSLTWLEIPDDGLTLGPLPYLVTEQVPFIVFMKEYGDRVGNGPDLKWYNRTELKKRINALKRQHLLTNNEANKMIKISQAISQGRSQRYSHPLALAIEAFKNNGEIVLHKERDKGTKEQILKTFKCNMATYRKYRKLGIDNGIMLVTIPDSRKVKELSALTQIRNYEYGLLGSQTIIHMLPYQPVTIPELEPVKDLYDAILSYLYGIHDRYMESWNTRVESTIIGEGIETEE